MKLKHIHHNPDVFLVWVFDVCVCVQQKKGKFNYSYKPSFTLLLHFLSIYFKSLFQLIDPLLHSHTSSSTFSPYISHYIFTSFSAQRDKFYIRNGVKLSSLELNAATHGRLYMLCLWFLFFVCCLCCVNLYYHVNIYIGSVPPPQHLVIIIASIIPTEGIITTIIGY